VKKITSCRSRKICSGQSGCYVKFVWRTPYKSNAKKSQTFTDSIYCLAREAANYFSARKTSEKLLLAIVLLVRRAQNFFFKVVVVEQRECENRHLRCKTATAQFFFVLVTNCTLKLTTYIYIYIYIYTYVCILTSRAHQTNSGLHLRKSLAAYKYIPLH